ncbi:MAG: glycosyltransferase family 39 protein [Anaerolineae bacterium]|nr:glycosyltransferase family 39 protein [Anaerolineae bacterium]
MKRTHVTQWRQWAIVIVLLWVQLGLRGWQITRRDPYIDEAYHLARASVVWDFEQHPGRFAHGKLLVYFWLGLFERTPSEALPVARLSIVVWSLISGAAIYAVGRRLAGHGVGALALALYGVLPLAVFYERLAMSDPFAAGLAGLVAWRSLVFAHAVNRSQPLTRHGIGLGVLIGLATLAKLTLVLLPLLPVWAALVFVNTPIHSITRRLRALRPTMTLSAIIVGLMWAPVLIPAWYADVTGDPFVLINRYNIQRDDPGAPTDSRDYVEQLWPVLADFVTREFLIVIGAAFVIGLVIASSQRAALFLLSWLVFLTAPLIAGARLPTAHYYVPMAAPVVLILALAAAQVWRQIGALRWPGARFTLQTAISSGLAVWIGLFALPWLHTELADPARTDFTGLNDLFYQSGMLTGDPGIRQAADTLTAAEPQNAPVYATWSVCHMLRLFTARPITCLGETTPRGDLIAGLQRDLPPGGTAYLAISGYGPFHENIDGLAWELAAEYDRVRVNRPVNIWRLWWAAEDP